MMPIVHLAFAIKGYPGTGRRVEADSDLATVSRPDLIQGAFMGDAVVELAGTDLSTRFGWVTLLDWCLCLSATVRALADSKISHFSFSESDDFMSFRRDGERLYAACSYRHGIAVVTFVEFADAVAAFAAEKIRWVSVNYPSALANPAMDDVLDRLHMAPRSTD
jgi:hypothetical protein